MEEPQHVCPGAGRNEPNVHAVRQDPNSEHWQGSELSVTILGSWQYYRAKARRWHCPVSGEMCLVEELSLLCSVVSHIDILSWAVALLHAHPGLLAEKHNLTWARVASGGCQAGIPALHTIKRINGQR